MMNCDDQFSFKIPSTYRNTSLSSHRDNITAAVTASFDYQHRTMYYLTDNDN